MMHSALKIRVIALVAVVLTAVLSLTGISPAQAVITCGNGSSTAAVETQQILVSEVCTSDSYIGPIATVGDTTDTYGLEGFGNVFFRDSSGNPTALNYTVNPGSTASNLTMTAIANSEIEHGYVNVEVSRVIQNSWILWSISVTKIDGSPGVIELGIGGFLGPQVSAATISVNQNGISTLVVAPTGASTTPNFVFKSSGNGFNSPSFTGTQLADTTHGALELNFGQVSSADLSLGVMPFNSCATVNQDAQLSTPGVAITQSMDPTCITPTPPGPPDPDPGQSTGTSLDYVCYGPQGMGSSAVESSVTSDFSSLNVCTTSAEISELEVKNPSGDGFESAIADSVFGTLFTVDSDGHPTVAIAGPSVDSSNPHEFIYTASDVYSEAAQSLVDVTVVRQITDNWVTWDITSVDSSSGEPAAIALFMAGIIFADAGTDFVWQGDSQVHTVNHVSSDIPQQVWLSGDGSEIELTRPDPQQAGGVLFSFGEVSNFSFSNGFYYSEPCGNPSLLSTATFADIGSPLTALGNSGSASFGIAFDPSAERVMDIQDCASLPYVDDVDLWNSDDSFDGFGALWVPDQMGGKHYIFDQSSSFSTNDSWALRVFHDDGVDTIDVNGQPVTVDITVSLTYLDSWVTWEIRAVDSTTGLPADIALTVEGNLGSDSETEIDTDSFDNFWVTSDGFTSDPALLWHANHVLTLERYDEQEHPDYISLVFEPASVIILDVGFLDLGPTYPDSGNPMATPEEVSSVLADIDAMLSNGEWNISDHPALSLIPSNDLYFEVGDTSFEEINRLSGNISEVSMAHTGDAFDGFGNIFTKDSNGEFQTEIIGETYSIDESSHSISYVAHNVYSFVEEDYVDVTVTRTFSQNWIRWQVESVFGEAAVRHTPGYTAQIEVQIQGNLGSDGNTGWEQVSTNDVWTSNDGHYGDPVLIWRPNGAPSVINHAQLDDGASVTFDPGSSLSLWLGLVDYELFEDRDFNSWTNECTISELVSQQADHSWDGNYWDFDPALYEGECAQAAVTSDFMSVSQGEHATLDFDLPDGSSCDEDHPRECPTVGIFSEGALESSGPLTDYQDREIAWDEFGSSATMASIEIVVYSKAFDFATEQEPARVSSRRIYFNPSGVSPVPLNATMSAQVGQSVSGSSVNFAVQGLQQGSPWTLDVNSATQTLDYAVWTQNGAVQRTISIPAGLPAGWHHFSFRAMGINNQPILATFWFEIDANGLLLATSTTDPSLVSPNNQNNGGSGGSGGSGGGSSNPQAPAGNVQAAQSSESSLVYTGSQAASFGDFAMWSIALGLLVLLVTKRKRRSS